MSKQQLFKLQSKIGKEKSVNAQVENLKKQLKLISDDYYIKSYQILTKIVQLRRTQIKGYSYYNLHKEEGIDLTQHQINYIYGYKYLTDFTKKEIEKGTLKTSTALYIVRQDKRYRSVEVQNRVVKEYLSGKLKVDEISRLKEQLVFDKRGYGEEIVKADKDLLSCYYKIEEIIKLIKSKRNLFSSLTIVSDLISQSEKLIKELEIVKKFGEKIKRVEEKNEEEEIRDWIK
jgi:hypothetical protein